MCVTKTRIFDTLKTKTRAAVVLSLCLPFLIDLVVGGFVDLILIAKKDSAAHTEDLLFSVSTARRCWFMIRVL